MANLHRKESYAPLTNTVDVVEAYDEWFVLVVDNGQRDLRAFAVEAVALSYAESQRVRLQLQGIVRM